MNLEDLEARLRTLMEVQLINVLPGQRAEDLIVRRLAETMSSEAVLQPDGRRLAPNEYRLLVSSDSLADWNRPELLDTLIEVLKVTAEAKNLNFHGTPTVALTGAPDLRKGTFEWSAFHSTKVMDKTMDMKPITPNESEDHEPLPENAFLIIEGEKVFPLVQTVVNMGRRLDNTLVIDDPRISRNHAQLRAIKGRFVLFDLNSTGGTFVNGQRINQSVLYAGDVISLAGVALIFGQDNPPPRTDLRDTSPLNEAAANRSTVVLKTMPPTKKKK